MLSTRGVVLCAFSLALVARAACDLELQLLHVLFRHGDKVPHREFQNYPTDPHRNHSYRPMGNGDLTNVGKMREYKIGTMLRERYDRFFGPDYWPSMIYARSTDVPRTQLSLQLALAGLFPPSEKQIWNTNLPWIPTWSFSVPYELDNLLFPHYCPKYKQEYNRFLQLDSTQEIISKYRNVLTYLSIHAGKVINTTAAASFVYNLFKEQEAQNLTLPEWALKVYPNPMKELLRLDFHLRSYTKTLRRLNGGTLLRKVVDDIREFSAGEMYPADRKAFFFSGHEVNVAAFARTLGTNDPLIPLYGSTIILETLRDEKGIYYVRVLLWTGVTEQLIPQKIPGCAEVCPFEEFISIMKDVLPTDDEYHCRRDDVDIKHTNHLHSSATSIVNESIWQHLLLTIFFVFIYVRA